MEDSDDGTDADGNIKHAWNHGERVTARFYSDLSRSKAPALPQFKGVLNKDCSQELGEAWTKFFHANGIPGENADCPHFREAMRLTQELGQGNHIPTGSEIDGPYLQSDQNTMNWRSMWPNSNMVGVSLVLLSFMDRTLNFMIFCDERIFIHKYVDATGHIQSARYLYEYIKEVVVEEIGEGVVVQIVTENGSNFKQVCGQLIKEYPHILWQPRAAHTITLMLKDIGNFPEVDAAVSSSKRICRFLYNHPELHAEMKTKIRPNATRFGTDFIFLQSYWDRKNKLRQWMISKEWTDSSLSKEADYDYTYDCLISRSWWEDVKWVLDIIRPLYVVLQYADSHKTRTLSGFMPRMMAARDELQSLFQEGSDDLKNFMDVVDKRDCRSIQ